MIDTIEDFKNHVKCCSKKNNAVGYGFNIAENIEAFLVFNGYVSKIEHMYQEQFHKYELTESGYALYVVPFLSPIQSMVPLLP